MDSQDLLRNCILIMAEDIDKIKTVSSEEAPLSVSDSKKLTDYAKTLIAIGKDERESIKGEGFSAMSDSELQQKASELLEMLAKESGE